jgi:tetratricopeptide (TPR) repeat protein
MLGDLQLGEFIYEQPAMGDTQYIFKHALTQEVSHNSVLLERRRQLHERIGGGIEAVFAANLQDHLAELAHHYSRSANRAKALEFLHRAGEQAITPAEAEACFTAALEVMGTVPESPERDARELRLRNSFAGVLAATKGYGPELLEMNSRARALAEKTGNLPELVQQLWWGANYASSRGDYSSAAALADQALETAQREGSPISLALIHQASLQARFCLGEFVAAEEHFARGRAFVEAPGFAQIAVFAEVLVVSTFGQGSWNAWITGHADTAREHIERMRRLLQGTRQIPFTTAIAQRAAASLHAMLREFLRAETLAGEALAAIEEHGFAEGTFYPRIPLGLARAELGRTAEGVALLRQALAVATESGARLLITETLTYLAEAQALDGAVADALRTIEDALRANPQELYLRPETLRVRGELQLRQGDRGAAEADFREAISLAQKMSAKAWELRAASSLARLLRDTRRLDEARAMLAEVYNWFTEGFDTADLKDAKALLDELSV